MLLGDGGGFVRCACGNRHWGPHGAAGLLLSDPERGVLLQRRAWWTHHGRTWALPGGAVRRGETPVEAAVREAAEEAAVPPAAVAVTAVSTEEHGTWRYTTVLATVREPVRVRAVSRESAELRWVPPERVADLPLHPDFAAAWPRLRVQLERRLVLVVDAANVVGARPDGWWRDPAAAARRLRDQLAVLGVAEVSGTALRVTADGDWCWRPRVVMVVEGRARGVEPRAPVEVVAAPRDGDSTIVEVTERLRAERPDDHVVVVTADRGLRARVADPATALLGPGTLRTLLDTHTP
ncbi:ADP-ribose pyrophosphatase YjhB, NUDIX family [Amycolatopsis arida]|uniref:ADP-ribose pyrophosphatase YjhB, NUDIX family n=1 Tax=Amycolatopsis arida TaxID=587909 RepID=A0A1I5VIQ7_9PSEU|nr:NUDIX hydrolase [Amycolatopsis arida]TDX87906.1 ADP-ribose pyrophosphatase YjhB (NUDIX family) [Amycolatopsis arida]SFQ07444.1 ADP-ribose pyrophosphatase YjhB, NUDIX family [Amycolatopsis arida]